MSLYVSLDFFFKTHHTIKMKTKDSQEIFPLLRLCPTTTCVQATKHGALIGENSTNAVGVQSLMNLFGCSGDAACFFSIWEGCVKETFCFYQSNYQLQLGQDLLWKCFQRHLGLNNTSWTIWRIKLSYKFEAFINFCKINSIWITFLFKNKTLFLSWKKKNLSCRLPCSVGFLWAMRKCGGNILSVVINHQKSSRSTCLLFPTIRLHSVDQSAIR